MHSLLRTIHTYCSWIHEIVNRGDVKLCKVHMNLNFDDWLTKPLSHPNNEKHTSAIGIRYPHDWVQCK
ncbi:hypothetical protein Zm00014a_028253 [Zea mays]|jgi:hypothetical protein|uniref:Uncharacterized protein n=1 Tax=Zea mays TaxID=4577 RepID=A0A317Y8H5_MAIZE|nr:hypothetical protein Zm00014a_028253 [Zea mays]